MSSVIDSLETSKSTLFYYCDYGDKRTLEPANVFGTLARQALERLEVVPEPLATDIERSDHDGERLLDPMKAAEFLERAIDLLPNPTFVIFDGLDEAEESAQKIICNGLRHSVNYATIPIKLLITGREETSSLLRIRATIPFSKISMSPSTIDMDIANYVRASTRRRISEGLLNIQDPMLEERIVQELVKGAKGMLVYVSLFLS